MNNNKPICSYCGQDYHGDTRIPCEVCHMQVCIMAFDPDSDMCLDCKSDLLPCECEICGRMIDKDDIGGYIICDTCDQRVCLGCSPDGIDCKECYDENKEEEDDE